MTPLRLIQEVVEDLEYETEYLAPEEQIPYERLHVLLGIDRENRASKLQLHFINDVALAVSGAEDLEETHDAVLLQFMLLFPGRVDAGYFGALAEYLLQLNRILPVGAFGISQPDGTVYYQYILALPEREVDENVLIEVIQMIDFFVGRFRLNIDRVSRGVATAAVVLDELRGEGLAPPPLQQEVPI
jgi:hypothetical protein